MNHCAVAAAVHAQAKAYLARFGHEATLGDDYAILITTREAAAQMQVLLKVDGVDRSMLVKLPAGDANEAEIDALAAAIFAGTARLLAGLP